MSFLVLIMIALQAASGVGQPNRKSLTASAAHLTTTPAFSFDQHAQCDAERNPYFLIPSAAEVSTVPFVMKLESNDTPTVYRVQDSGLKASEDGLFSVVRKSGRVWLLLQTVGAPQAFAFDNNGKQTSTVSLDVPTGFTAETFAVTNMGTVFVGGYFNGKAAPMFKNATFAGVFEGSTGRLLNRVDALSGQVMNGQILKDPRDMAAAVGPDGNFYVAALGKLAIVSVSGRAISSKLIPRPPEGGVVSAIEPTNETILMQFMVPFSDRTKPPSVLLATVDRGLWKIVETAQPDQTLGNNIVCTQDNYTFLRFENGKVKFVTSAATQ